MFPWQDLVKGVPAPPGGEEGGGGPPGLPLLFGKMASATLEISIFNGNLLKLPPPTGREALRGRRRRRRQGVFSADFH